MKVWLPFTDARSGSTVFTKMLARGLQARGIEAVVQVFPHRFQYAPWLLRQVMPPEKATAVITNSWSGFAFHRAGLDSICVEHLFVLDRRLAPYKTFAQAQFHKQFVGRFNRWSYQSARHVVAVSNYTAHAIREFWPDQPVKVITNGIDTDFFSPGSLRVSGEPFDLLFVGNITRRKGADLLPLIMDRLGPGFRLKFTATLSDAPPGFDLPNMQPLGRLSPENLRSEYRQTGALIVPTRLEGLPLSVLEAMACGCPVISSDSASLPEAVENDVTGLVCPVDDVGAFVDAIKRLSADAELRTRLSTRARQSALQNFTLGRLAEDYLELLTQSVA